MKTLLHYVLEADDDKGTDYTATGPTEEDNITEDDEKEDTIKATDYGADAPNDDEDDTTKNNDEDATDTEGDDSPTDYGSEAPTDDNDDAEADQEPEPADTGGGATTDEEVQDTKKNSVLIEDFISLYYMIGSFNDKISLIDKTNADVNRITHQVMSNFLELRKKLFNYIRYDFSSTNYIGNLYAYNSFIEASKLNAAILQESKVFTDSKDLNVISKVSKKR